VGACERNFAQIFASATSCSKRFPTGDGKILAFRTKRMANRARFASRRLFFETLSKDKSGTSVKSPWIRFRGEAPRGVYVDVLIVLDAGCTLV
jgi:hypothetical protein